MAETKSTSVWQRNLSFMDTFAYKKGMKGCNMSLEDLIQQSHPTDKDVTHLIFTGQLVFKLMLYKC